MTEAKDDDGEEEDEEVKEMKMEEKKNEEDEEKKEAAKIKSSSLEVCNPFAFVEFEGIRSKDMEQSINQAALGAVVALDSQVDPYFIPVFGTLGPMVELWAVVPAATSNKFALFHIAEFNLMVPHDLWRCAMAILWTLVVPDKISIRFFFLFIISFP
jgi:hypothetical protein